MFNLNILLTGGAGFIGSHLAERLLKEGHKVVIADDLSLGKLSNLESFSKNPNLSVSIGDINNEGFLEALFKKHKFDIVFHLAANSDVMRGSTDSQVDFQKTFMTTFNVLEAMKKFGVKRIVFSSTSAIYGPAKGKLNEDHGPLQPISSYGASKLASEAFISVAVDNHGFQAWIFRFPNVVGERATHGAIFDFINKLKKTPKKLEVLGDGTQCKPYMYVKDLVDGIIYGWKNSSEKLNIFNLSSKGKTTVREMADMTVEEMGSKASIVYGSGKIGWVGDVPSFEYDTAKIERLGWKPKHDSNEAVRLAIRKMLEENK